MSPRSSRLLKVVLLASMVCAAFAATPAGAATSQVSPSYYHACALESSGSVKCFGGNWYGESAGVISTDYVSPTTVDLGSSAIAVSAGTYHSCAVLTGGTVKCWGAGTSGELGDGASSDSATPVTADVGEPAKAVVAANYASCALLESGNVKCWGYDEDGLVGVGNNSNEPTPVQVDLDGNKAVSITGGYSKMCAVVENGGLWCWGSNGYGEIDSGSGSTVYYPTLVDTGAPVESVAADYEHICALFAAGVVKCWGGNYDSQLGDGTTNSTSVPFTVDLGEPAVKVTVGWYHSCAVLASGTAKCWGDNEYGQITSDDSTANYLVPTTYDAGGPITTLDAGAGVTCATLATHELKCSGYYVPYYMSDASKSDYQFEPLLISGVDFSPPAPPPPTTIAGKIAKPSWKLKRKGSKITASATLQITADGMDAEHCVGNLQVSVPPSTSGSGGSGGGGGGGGTGTGSGATAPTFALKFADGKCTASAKRSVPARVAKRGVRLRIFLKDAPLLTAGTYTSTTKLPK